MDDEELSAGDVVQLKSGGPFMTVVVAIKQRPVVICGWFWSGRYRTERFRIVELLRPSAEALQAAANLRNKIAGPGRAQGERARKNSPAG